MKICKNFEEKNHSLVHGILEYYTSEKYSIIKNQAWAIAKQPAERGKRAVHFRCFCIKCWNRHITGDKTNSMKSSSACNSSYSNLVWADSRDKCTKNFKSIRNYRVLTILESGDQNFSKKQGKVAPQKGG